MAVFRSDSRLRQTRPFVAPRSNSPTPLSARRAASDHYEMREQARGATARQQPGNVTRNRLDHRVIRCIVGTPIHRRSKGPPIQVTPSCGSSPSRYSPWSQLQAGRRTRRTPLRLPIFRLDIQSSRDRLMRIQCDGDSVPLTVRVTRESDGSPVNGAIVTTDAGPTTTNRRGVSARGDYPGDTDSGRFSAKVLQRRRQPDGVTMLYASPATGVTYSCPFPTGEFGLTVRACSSTRIAMA